MSISISDTLADALRDRARAHGFDAVRITRPGAIPQAPGRLQQFLDAGHHGGMDWLEEKRAWRGNPQALWPQAGAGDATSIARSLILWQWRWRAQGELARVGLLPLQLLARHGVRSSEAYGEPASAPTAVRAVWQDLAGELLRLPTPHAGPRLRRIGTRLDTLALKRLQRGDAKPFPTSGLAVLWQCWQGGRGTPA